MTEEKMMADIVERIRFFIAVRNGPAKDADGNYIGTCWPMMLEAADEIERLRASAVGATGAREAHTPMPWRVDDTRIISTAEGIADDLICVWDGADTPNWKADAAFIVEACNSHGIQFGAGAREALDREAGFVMVPCKPSDEQIISALEWALEWMRAHNVDGLSPFKDYPPIKATIAGMYAAMLSVLLSDPVRRS